MTLILASASPRRRELLEPFFPNLKIKHSSIDEKFPPTISLNDAKKLAEELALAKARDVSSNTEDVILGADTMVLCDGHLLGKPTSREHALEMLSMLSGATHQVVTGIALTDGKVERTDSVVSNVEFHILDPVDITTYLDMEDYADKAGSYGIQSEGWRLVKRVEGSWSNVVGLPLKATSTLLSSFGVDMNVESGPVLVVVGMPGAGKEEFVQMARSRLYSIVRMGDVVREEAAKQGIDTTDTGIGGFASAERKQLGPNIWAERSIKKLIDLDAYKIVVDGTRSHHEVEAFRDVLGSRMRLVAVTTSQKTRYDRLVERARSDAPSTFEQFKIRDDRELGWGIGRALDMADINIPNEGTLKEFHSKANEFLDNL